MCCCPFEGHIYVVVFGYVIHTTTTTAANTKTI